MSQALVQSKLVASAYADATTVTASGHGFASPTTAGNLLILVVWAEADFLDVATAPTIGMPSTAGFTWATASSAIYSDSLGGSMAGRVAIYYIANAASMASTLATSVTATRSTAIDVSVDFACYEFSGVKTSGALDKTS